MGCNIGRCVNRIAKGHFIINDKEYQLECNDGENTIHSGFCAYCRRKWKYADSDDDSVTFVLNSRDGDQGFPGNLIVYITYRFLSDNEFETITGLLMSQAAFIESLTLRVIYQEYR